MSPVTLQVKIPLFVLSLPSVAWEMQTVFRQCGSIFVVSQTQWTLLVRLGVSGAPCPLAAASSAAFCRVLLRPPFSSPTSNPFKLFFCSHFFPIIFSIINFKNVGHPKDARVVNTLLTIRYLSQGYVCLCLPNVRPSSLSYHV